LTGYVVVSAQYSTVQYSTVQYSTVQYSTVQYSTVQYSTVQYSTVQYSTALIVSVVQNSNGVASYPEGGFSAARSAVESAIVRQLFAMFSLLRLVSAITVGGTVSVSRLS
jgi:hypothetical protein